MRKPTIVHIWYMHDNHTFSRIVGRLDEILAKAKALSIKSPYGMLAKPILLDDHGEVERVGVNIHADKDGFHDKTLNLWFSALPDRVIEMIDQGKAS